MRTRQPLLTAEEFALLPDDSSRESLIRGAIAFREPPPGWFHGTTEVKIAGLLDTFAAPRHLGTVVHNVGFVLERNPDTVLGPDVAFVAAVRLPSEMPHPYFSGAPDIAVEVLSPSNRKKEIALKIALYFAAGGRQVWVVDPPHRTVTIHRPHHDPHLLNADDVLTGDDVLPGFECRVADCFGTYP
jgi:Uma2 family endonuclease